MPIKAKPRKKPPTKKPPTTAWRDGQAPAYIPRMGGSGVTATDQFCGAGGTSLGLDSMGVEVLLAMNHWKLAIDTHQTNFPQTRHACTDISACDPRHYGRTDILVTSPECTNHTMAKGRARRYQSADLWGELPDPSEDRSRATMWDVPRFCEAHGYNVVVVENVVDASDWVMWSSWLHAMTVSLPYDYRVVSFNSMFAYPTPQSRDRIYVVFWRRGITPPDLDFYPPAWCPKCAQNVASVQSWKPTKKGMTKIGKYRQQYVYCCPQCASIVEPYYYCAANAIDWSLPAERIGDRARPLKPKTMARIEEGLRRFSREPWPLLFSTDQSVIGRNLKTTADVFPTQTTATTMGLAVQPASPVPFLFTEGGGWATDYRSVGERMPTVTGSRTMMLVDPFVVSVGHGGVDSVGRVRHPSEPLHTQYTQNSEGVVVPPHLLVSLTRPDRPRPGTEAWPTQTGTQTEGVFVLPLEHGGAQDHAMRSAARELLTQSTRQGHALVVAPFVLPTDSRSPVRGATEAPMPTQTTQANPTAILAPFTIAYNGTGGPAHGLEEALGAQTSHDRHALIEPGQLPRAEDCGFRILKPHEIQRAMAFPASYQVLGTVRDRTKQLGNAVTPPVAAMIMERCVATLAGRERTA